MAYSDGATLTPVPTKPSLKTSITAYISSHFSPMVQEPTPYARPAITFINGSLEGSPGCGAFFGARYTLSGDRLSIPSPSAVIGGGMCPSEAEQIESYVVKAMKKVTHWRKNNDHIQLLGEDDAVEIELAR